ncbi:hypothetical protein KY285_010455 [Solanum tuberosum]|nr:hypothetical protein KY289_011010 [Solanum tuberosum]KAH0734748.1 hypothetical protein KY285_010455 [Solanum tuberosum]
MTRERETGHEWFVTHLNGGHMPIWIEKNHQINFLEFTTVAKTWISIICSRMIPSSNETDVSLYMTLLICAIMEGIHISFGRIIMQHNQEVILEDKVEQHEGDSMWSPEGPIYLLKNKGPWHVTKKRKIDVQDLAFDTFIKGITSLGLDSIAPLSELV